MRPFLNDIPWPGRRVRTGETAKPAEDTTQPRAADRREAISLVGAQHHDTLRKRFAETDQTIRQVEEKAREALRSNLGFTLENRPQMREALSAMGGHHTLTTVPEKDQLPASNTITLEHYERSYDTLRNAGTISFGFDPTQLISDEYTGTVTRFGGMTSPVEAAGYRTPPILAANEPFHIALENHTLLKKREVFYMLFVATVCFILRTIADAIRRIGDTLRNALTIKILKKRISLGKWIAKPFHWLAKKLYRLADKWEEIAMGLEPTRPEVGYPEIHEDELWSDLADTSDDTLSVQSPNPQVFETLDAMDQDTRPEASTSRYESTQGQFYLMHAFQLIQGVDSQARQPGSESLQQALTDYHRARELRDSFEVVRQTSLSWGVTPGIPGRAIFDLRRLQGFGPETSTVSAATGQDGATGGEADPADPAFAC